MVTLSTPLPNQQTSPSVIQSVMANIDTLGFPPGYFVIRSVATGKVLDVAGDEIEDGTGIALWPEKEKSLVESFRDPSTNNQVFFIDTSGALCSRSSGHAIDVEGDALVLRHRRPVSQPFPNSYSHPLPRFSYSSTTGEISICFSCDPSYPTHPQSTTWQNKTYLLTALPKRRPRTIIDNASDFIASSFSGPISFLTGTPAPSPAKPDEVFNADIDLAEEEVLEEERGEEAEVDDSPDPARQVKVVAVPTGEKAMLDLLLGEKTRNRRRWQLLPLRLAPSKTTL